MISSCDDSNGTNEISDLYGTWNMDNATVEMTVGGLDLTQILISTFSYQDAEAEAWVDSLMMEMTEGFEGTLSFNEDMSYTITIPGEGSDIGTYTLSDDGLTLTLTDDSADSDDITVVELSSKTMILKLEAEDIELDLDGDYEDETLVLLSFEIELSKI